MNEKPRRILGALLGLVVALVYGLVTETINRFALPGLPLYEPSPGIFATVLLYGLGGGLVGLLVAWFDESVSGVVGGALGGALLTSLAAIYAAQQSSHAGGAAFALQFITFLPRAVLFLPVTAVIAWGIGQWKQELVSEDFSVLRLALPLLLLPALALGLGSFSLYGKEARQSLLTTQDLIRTGQQAGSRGELPEPLLHVEGFLENARGPYTLRLTENADELPVQRAAAAANVQEYAVFVVFENGYHFGCAYTHPKMAPFCGAY
jgi:hypothetical protein